MQSMITTHTTNGKLYPDAGSYWTYVEKTRLRRIIALAPTMNLGRYLDVGCGDGQFFRGLRRHFQIEDAFGVDSSGTALLAANKEGLQTKKVDLSSDVLPFANGTFDTVSMIEVIEHLHDVEHCLKEVSRVLRPGGFLLLTTPNMASWHGRVSLIAGYQPLCLDIGYRRHYGSLITLSGKSAGHIRGFTLPALKELLDEFNFRLVGVGGEPAVVSGMSLAIRALAQLDRAISTFSSFASGFVIWCTTKPADATHKPKRFATA